MHLIQILLPLYSKEKQLFPSDSYLKIRKELTEKFGGITTYTRSPAIGLWKENEEKTVRDEIVIYEVMATTVERDWWGKYKEQLEKTYQQEEIIVRGWEIELL